MLRYLGLTSLHVASSAPRISASFADCDDIRLADDHANAGNADGDYRHDSSIRGPLVTKLKSFVKLDVNEVEMLEGFCRNSRSYEVNHNLIQEGSNPGCIFIVLSGLAYRFKLQPDGHRQILGYLVPGDICDLSFTILDWADHNVSVLVPSRIAKFPLRKFIDSVATSVNVTRGLQLAAHLDTVIMREWLLNTGQSKAEQKLSHFLCEMATRLKKVGKISEDGWFDFPVNQVMLADTIGLTAVHINRTLQRLRRDGVILLDRRRLNILDMRRLRATANFEGRYLNSLDLVS